jgi:hypothetical protein
VLILFSLLSWTLSVDAVICEKTRPELLEAGLVKITPAQFI